MLRSQFHVKWGQHMKDHLQDIAGVRAVIQLYIDGASGDATKLKEAFHPDARMFGHIGEMAAYVPIGDFIGMVESSPSMAGPNYSADVRTVDVIGDAGVAVLVEHDYLGCDFVDYFTVARIDGRWWITCKTFAHTGGSMPAH
jgi:hypothetical protein